MPYIKKEDRPLLRELLVELRRNPTWRSPEGEEKNAVLMSMLLDWLKVKNKENPLKMDGDINFICTWMLKHTHQTCHLKDGKKILCPLDKEASSFVREVLTKMFEYIRGYSNYERLYGLLSLMEAEFERRGWSLGRKDLKDFFHNEKLYWRKRIADYEDGTIDRNGDLD